MSKSYEELTGASGRERFFRSERQEAGPLFAGSPPTVWFDDLSLELRDISGVGLGCAIDEERAPKRITPGAPGVLRLTQAGEELFRAKARMARLAPDGDRLVIGVALEEGVFDIDALRRENARAAAVRAIDFSASARVPDEYKRFCADVVDFLALFRRQIDRFYAPMEARMGDGARAEAAASFANAAEPRWRALLAEGARIVLPHHRDKSARLTLKAFTERVVTPELLAGEGWRRSYEKPLGYPGDFAIMNHIYDQSDAGETIYEKFLHRLSLTGSLPVKTRMEHLTTLAAAHMRARGGERFDLLSIGAGSARELEGVAALAPDGMTVDATLIDQEPRALEFATRNARIASRAANLEARALNVSFREMLNPTGLASVYQNKDFIYSLGLVDYLNPLIAQRFTRRAYDLLKPGGQLIIGNLNDLEDGMIWPCEYVTDWTLYFRSREEMAAMASFLPDDQIRIETDPLGGIYFLILTKPAG